MMDFQFDMDIDVKDMTMGFAAKEPTIPDASAFCFCIPVMESFELDFQQCCQANQLLSAMAIYNANPHMDLGYNDEEAFATVCAHGNLVFARWIYATHDVYPRHPKQIIHDMCEKGHLNMLLWLHEIGFIGDTPMKRAYFLAVKNNHVAVTNWIVDAYPNFNQIEMDEDEYKI